MCYVKAFPSFSRVVDPAPGSGGDKVLLGIIGVGIGSVLLLSMMASKRPLTVFGDWRDRLLNYGVPALLVAMAMPIATEVGREVGKKIAKKISEKI